MRINKIKLYNFGSYEGRNEIVLESPNEDKRMIVIGGKNGAGKTTLFTAIQTCLYGNFSFGFKTAGKLYLKEIYNLINNKVRLDEKGFSYVEISFSEISGTEIVDYVVRREWQWPKNEIKENLVVFKNGEALNEEDLVNFQNYLLHLIPPDMLKLYFFDGEKIADYFLSDNEINIHDTLMVLSGNDTFSILYDNVSKVLKSSENSQLSIANDYLEAKSKYINSLEKCVSIENEIANCDTEIQDLNMQMESHKKEYSNNGGVTLDEWKDLQDKLKEEETIREHLNMSNKSLATEMLPFVIIFDQVKQIIPQIDIEREYSSYNMLKKSIDNKDFENILVNAVKETSSINEEKDAHVIFEKIKEHLLDNKFEGFEPLFHLSNDEEAEVQTVVKKALSFDSNIFSKNRKEINKSLRRSKKIRTTLQKSNIENYKEYITLISSIEEKISILQAKIIMLNEKLEETKENTAVLENNMNALKKDFEEQLKKKSVSSISGKVLMLLEDLQDYLSKTMIKQVEKDLNSKFKELIRKKDFFDYITIDDRFVVHILRNQKISKTDLIYLLKSSNIYALGENAVEELKKQFNISDVQKLNDKLKESMEEEFVLPVEIDKNRLSSGEKQIFIMSLYWSMMQQSKNELPFIIDTPFARIDKEHRSNITNKFFKELPGQLIILSTDEEISGKHIGEMWDQISHIYMLEYGEDKATHVHSDLYFEV